MSDTAARRPAGGPHGPHGPGPRVAEKPKNFKKSMAKLIAFVKPFFVPVVIALVSNLFAFCVGCLLCRIL